MNMQASGTMVGTGLKIAAVKEFAVRVARANCNVLVTGETGTGKELIARLIHSLSLRAKSPLVCFNCAAIPDALLEAELFGHEKGAYTGGLAAERRANRRIAFRYVIPRRDRGNEPLCTG